MVPIIICRIIIVIPMVINISAVLKIVYGGNSCHNKKSITPPLCKNLSVKLPIVPAITKLRPSALLIDLVNNSQVLLAIATRKAKVIRKIFLILKKTKSRTIINNKF